ncbi:hypothetical protein S7711_07422 [Stachybotrys chartarum IBT 7711]|uniref:Peptidyl-tRNA hydrolase n=1 Tax=Stachybotrys chartarum (strain CBS 109288 / IBT 7711) TaxID=1280523 RepID=A0A084AFI1_STACB|nr:hypothetical protein S7711_07422 [Stachybotrys chartarum IBT 7711]KFA47739.1 hypothetical protein S40293_07139 [Stachybotrys chartarum IBT 40293]KFA78938.1 hypothetical protein S40288_00645 [Stachybotrys chartarum IBT 40288]
MRFSTSVAFAALPAVAVAQDFEQYAAQFQNFLGRFGSYIPSTGTHDPVAATEAKLGSMKLHTLTLDNWKETLYEPVPEGATTPVEWWVLSSGRNKTCNGRCESVETAFNQTAAKFALQPSSPYMAYLNCDDQPILCNSWSAAASTLWIFEMLPPPAPVEVWKKRLNLTTTTDETLLQLQNVNREEKFHRVSGFFHPFDGTLAKYGVAVPVGYLFWAMGLVPNWLFMLVVSLVSRTMMSKRMTGAMAAQDAREGR